MITIIQTQFKDMPSSLLAELGSYRYGVFMRGEGWSIPSRLHTPGQEYDRFDRSDVMWLIAWSEQLGICGCARLIPWRKPRSRVVNPVGMDVDTARIWEMSRFSARLNISTELPMQILWHALQLAEIQGHQAIISATTPMLEKMFEEHGVDVMPLMPGLIQSEDNLFAVRIPVSQPRLTEKFHGSRRFSPSEVLPRLGVTTWRTHGGEFNETLPTT